MTAGEDRDTILEMFKAYLEDLGRIGGRQESARAFYLSVISALFAFLTLAGTSGSRLFNVQGTAYFIAGLVGISICVLWFSHMRSFFELFEAKLETLRELEKNLPFPLFATEKLKLDSRDYRHITVIDTLVALAFVLLFAGLIYANVTAAR